MISVSGEIEHMSSVAQIFSVIDYLDVPLTEAVGVASNVVDKSSSIAEIPIGN